MTISNASLMFHYLEKFDREVCIVGCCIDRKKHECFAMTNKLRTNHEDGETATADREKLVRMLYDAVLDNTMWPEVISELLLHIDEAGARQQSNIEAPWLMSDLNEHLTRARLLSDRLHDLKGENDTLLGVLDMLPLGIAAFSGDGVLLYANTQACNHGLDQPDQTTITCTTENHPPIELSLDEAVSQFTPPEPFASAKYRNETGSGELTALAANNIANRNFPTETATILISTPNSQERLDQHLQQTYFLTVAEMRLLRALIETGDVTAAANECSISPTHAKRAFDRISAKTCTENASSLVDLMSSYPRYVIHTLEAADVSGSNLRRMVTFPDGRKMEYFSLGPEEGHAVLNFDGFIGISLDVLGASNRYLKILRELNLRIITPCRPGTFSSDYKRYKGFSEQAADLITFLDLVNIDRISILSQTIGTGAALSVAAAIPQRVNQVVLTGAVYPEQEPDAWQSKNLFFVITGLIGKRAPWMLESIMPFLVRSIMHDPKQFVERSIRRTYCRADIEILSNPNIQRRLKDVLAERTSSGYDGIVQENYLGIHGWDFELSSITCPVQLLHGALDATNDPKGARLLASRLPNANLSLFSDLGQHLLVTEWPWILELCAGRMPTDIPSITTTIIPAELLSKTFNDLPDNTHH